MANNNLDDLAVLIIKEREKLIAHWKEQVRQIPSARALAIPTLIDHIPLLLDELATALHVQSDQTIPQALREGSAADHGRQRLHDAFDIEEVVAEYNVLRGCIHDLADSNGLILQGKSFHTINRVFDHAIGLAVQTYSSQHALEVQQRREEYLAFVAHDLRTPLSATSLAVKVLEMLHPEASASVETTKMLKALRRNVKQLELLVGKVLEENANLQTEIGVKLERREFDLWPLIEALLHDLQPVAVSGKTRLVNSVPDDLVVFGDASALRRVFQNLIANAIKYTPDGEVLIAAQANELGKVECTVSDNGMGIPKAFIDKVFDKGETDPNSQGGAGLGLAIVRTFIEAHGGTVSVQSEEGAGSVFRLSLPTKERKH